MEVEVVSVVAILFLGLGHGQLLDHHNKLSLHSSHLADELDLQSLTITTAVTNNNSTSAEGKNDMDGKNQDEPQGSVAPQEYDVTTEKEAVTTELPAVLATLLPMVAKENATKKPSVVAKKGVGTDVYNETKAQEDISLLSRVQGRKDANPEFTTPSVHSRKGADPESYTPPVLPDPTVTPSVYGRKGVELDNATVLPEEMPGMETIYSNTPKTFVPEKISMSTGLQSLTKDKSSNKLSTDRPYYKPMPQLVPNKNVDANNSLEKEPSHSEKLTPPKKTEKGNSSTTTRLHAKPSSANDDLKNATSTFVTITSRVDYMAVLLAIGVFIALMLVVVVGYRKLQYVWMRRRYDPVDFLVDGMYDEM